jgi:DNA polymerase phi
MSSTREAFLSSFYSLASAEDAERSAAACAIAVHLNSEQRSFEAAGAAVPEGLSDAFAQAGACRELVYAIKRLVRGLTSSRGCARQGFATALARVISDDTLAEPTPLRCILVLLDETTDCPNGLKGQEAREKLFGRIFGYVALQRSGRLYAAAGADESAESAVEAQMARALLLIGRQKPYLREVCAQAVAALVWSAPSVEALRAKLLPALKAEWEGECIEWTAEQLGLAFHVAHFIALRGDGDDELPNWLTDVIAATAATRSNAEQWRPSLVESARTFPRVHSIWGILATSADALASAYTRDGATTSLVDDAARFGSTRTGALELVWAAVVEPHLVKKGSTDQRKFLGLELVARLMASENADPALRPRLLTAQVVACIVNNCGSANSYVQTPAKRALEAVESAIARAAAAAAVAPKAKKTKKAKKAKKEQSGGAGELSVLFALLEHSSAAHGGRAKGSGNKKDGRSKGAAMVMEVTGRLLGSLDASAIAAYVEWVASHLSASAGGARASAESDAAAAEAVKDALEMKQLWAAQTLSSTLANARLPRSAAWMGAAMRALEDGAFGAPAAATLSPRARSQCESYFFKSLHALSTSALSASQRLGGAATGELEWTALFARVAARQSALVARVAAGRAPISALSRRAAKLLEALAARRATRSNEAPSRKRKRKRSDGIDAASAHADALYACTVLIGASAFTLARAPGAAARAAEQLSELCDCADALLGAKAGTVAVLMRAPTAAADAESSDSDADEGAMEGAAEVAVPAASIVVELLLSMLSDPLPGVRDLVKAVFALLCPSLAADAVLELCDVVATSEGMLDVNVDGDSEDEEESDNGDGKPFTAADLSVGDVGAALGNSWKSDASSDDGDSDGEEEEEGGDAVSRAERENEMLSAIVRMRVMKRDGLKESRNLKNKQIDFRLRVLDLVETYVARMPHSPIVLDLVVPLLDALHATGGTLRGGARAGKSGRQVRGLHDRLRTVIVNRVCGAKLLPTLALDADAAAELHERAEAAMAHALGAQLPDVNDSAGVAVIYFLRVLARNGALDVARARAVLRKAALNLLCTKRQRVRKRFFELLAKPVELSAATWSIVPTLLNIAAGAETDTVMQKKVGEEGDEEEEEEVEVVMRPKSSFQRALAYELTALALNAAAADAALHAEAAAAMPALLRVFATAAREHAEPETEEERAGAVVQLKKPVHLRLLFKFGSAVLKLGARVAAGALTRAEIIAIGAAGTEAAEAGAEFAVLSQSGNKAVKAQGKSFGVQCAKWVSALGAKAPSSSGRSGGAATGGAAARAGGSGKTKKKKQKKQRK